MIHVSEAQYRMFEEQRRGPQTPRAPRQKRPKCEWPENILEGQIKSFMESRGWVVRRNHVGTFVPLRILMGIWQRNQTVAMEGIRKNLVRVNEKGTADWVATRTARSAGYGMVQRFWYEVKAPGKRPSPEQRVWLEERVALGEVAVWFDGFEGEWDTCFLRWYQERFGE